MKNLQSKWDGLPAWKKADLERRAAEETERNRIARADRIDELEAGCQLHDERAEVEGRVKRRRCLMSNARLDDDALEELRVMHNSDEFTRMKVTNLRAQAMKCPERIDISKQLELSQIGVYGEGDQAAPQVPDWLCKLTWNRDSCSQLVIIVGNQPYKFVYATINPTFVSWVPLKRVTKISMSEKAKHHIRSKRNFLDVSTFEHAFEMDARDLLARHRLPDCDLIDVRALDEVRGALDGPSHPRDTTDRCRLQLDTFVLVFTWF
jgi:hypothetical protein